MWPCPEAATADGHARYARLARYNPAPPPLWGEVPESGWRVRVSLGLHRISRSRLTQGAVSLPPMSLATPLGMPTSGQGASSEGSPGWRQASAHEIREGHGVARAPCLQQQC